MLCMRQCRSYEGYPLWNDLVFFRCDVLNTFEGVFVTFSGEFVRFRRVLFLPTRGTPFRRLGELGEMYEVLRSLARLWQKWAVFLTIWEKN